jgi:hypothetical protein
MFDWYFLWGGGVIVEFMGLLSRVMIDRREREVKRGKERSEERENDER